MTWWHFPVQSCPALHLNNKNTHTKTKQQVHNLFLFFKFQLSCWIASLRKKHGVMLMCVRFIKMKTGYKAKGILVLSLGSPHSVGIWTTVSFNLHLMTIGVKKTNSWELLKAFWWVPSMVLGLCAPLWHLHAPTAHARCLVAWMGPWHPVAHSPLNPLSPAPSTVTGARMDIVGNNTWDHSNSAFLKA